MGIKELLGFNKPSPKKEMNTPKEVDLETIRINLPTSTALDQNFADILHLVQSIAIKKDSTHGIGGSTGTGQGQHYRPELPKKYVIESEEPYISYIFIPKSPEIEINHSKIIKVFFMGGAGGYLYIMPEEQKEEALRVLQAHKKSLSTSSE